MKLFRILSKNCLLLKSQKNSFTTSFILPPKFRSIRYFRYFRHFCFHPEQMQTFKSLTYIQLCSDELPQWIKYLLFLIADIVFYIFLSQAKLLVLPLIVANNFSCIFLLSSTIRQIKVLQVFEQKSKLGRAQNTQQAQIKIGKEPTTGQLIFKVQGIAGQWLHMLTCICRVQTTIAFPSKINIWL